MPAPDDAAAWLDLLRMLGDKSQAPRMLYLLYTLHSSHYLDSGPTKHITFSKAAQKKLLSKEVRR